MGLSPKEQIKEQIAKSETILICVSKNPNGDALGSALGLFFVLKKMGKKVDVVSPTAVLNKYLFLPSVDLITHKVEGARDYILSMDVEKEKLQQLRYEVKDNNLKIFVTVKNKKIDDKDIKLESSRFKYDLVIALCTPDLESLGNIYDENPELFFDTPLVNIDHNPSNEYFGKMNLVDVAVSSTSEIIFNLISDLGSNLIDENSATGLLTGIISETESFQNRNTTPKAFMAAASLIASGANKQDIIRYLYKTKSISMLKLMGKIMSNLKYSGQYKLGWSVIDEENFASNGANLEDLLLSIQELASSSPEFDLIMLLYRKGGKINGIINFAEKMSVDILAKSLKGSIRDRNIIFVCNENNIETAEKDILKKIKSWIDNAVQ